MPGQPTNNQQDQALEQYLEDFDSPDDSDDNKDDVYNYRPIFRGILELINEEQELKEDNKEAPRAQLQENKAPIHHQTANRQLSNPVEPSSARPSPQAPQRRLPNVPLQQHSQQHQTPQTLNPQTTRTVPTPTQNQRRQMAEYQMPPYPMQPSPMVAHPRAYLMAQQPIMPCFPEQLPPYYEQIPLPGENLIPHFEAAVYSQRQIVRDNDMLIHGYLNEYFPPQLPPHLPPYFPPHLQPYFSPYEQPYIQAPMVYHVAPPHVFQPYDYQHLPPRMPQNVQEQPRTSVQSRMSPIALRPEETGQSQHR